MAVDKLVDSTQLDADLTSVADAIRTKGGTSAQLAFPAGFVSAIGNIPTGGGGTSYGVNTTSSILGLVYGIENYDANYLASGTISFSSYPSTSSEIVLLDTGFNDGERVGIAIMDVTGGYISGESNQNMYICYGVFGAGTAGTDQAEVTAFGFNHPNGSAGTKMFGNRATSYRYNGGKLMYKPQSADSRYTYFRPGRTYRWFAWEYQSA